MKPSGPSSFSFCNFAKLFQVVTIFYYLFTDLNVSPKTMIQKWMETNITSTKAAIMTSLTNNRAVICKGYKAGTDLLRVV